MKRERESGPAQLVAAARAAGVKDERVFEAVALVARAQFVPPEAAAAAYRDTAIPISHGQFTSQPSLIARMLEALALRGDEKALELGTGYGYQTALLALLAREVWSIELWSDMVRATGASLAAAGVGNVHLLSGDGTLGVPEQAPFDAIVITAAHPRVPPPLCEQLSPGGRLVQPIGPGGREEVCVFVKRGGELELEGSIAPARFVRLHGAHGFDD